MSTFPKKSPIQREEGIIRPGRGKKDPRIGFDVVMVMIGRDLEDLVRQNGPAHFEVHRLDFFRLYRVKNPSKAEGPPALCGPFLGAPQAVMGLEKVIALGARRIWVLGWCGSLQPDLKVGNLVLPTGALIEEGTSPHYPIGTRESVPDRSLSDMIDAALIQRGETCKRGRIWTTDAPYRETPSKISAYRDLGILAVEMEMSALMTVALYRSVKLSGLLVVSDELSNLTWHRGFSDPVFRRSVALAANTLFDLAKGKAEPVDG